ncbi:hypothetical protein PVT67_07090 [Gallaecimonas kandeliae]|uniref:hypothetical protein n=1 Tax=Gallaecimonas kandeliae TaxID=3029055 RepID=UPI0026493E4A|nr:hypothetical protein [Gallaecimonas kandeliae]WKE66995.1 hypothetical protein PVT67_07090 [Gallaecimonas kandeliae]
MLYSIAGSLNTAFIFVSFYGVWTQLAKVLGRKDAGEGRPTEILSLNQFTVSFLAYWSFFVYGFSIQPFNHFIVWPRLLGSLLVLAILFEIYRDRGSRTARLALATGALLMILGLVGLVAGHRYVDEGKLLSQGLIVTITVLLAQGYLHQIGLILKAGRTGAVSLKMSQFILAMDVTTIFFALVMGLETGWPLLLLASVSAATKLAIMWLFRWVRLSPAARGRREAAA